MKLFGTDGIRGEANRFPINGEVALKLGKAFAKVMSKNKKPLFLIGKDTRLSGYMLEYALTAGLTSMGADVLLVGPIPTPGVAYLIRTFKADAGIMITASHNPYTDNGIKLFDSDGKKLPDTVENKIEDLILNHKIDTAHVTSKNIGKVKRIDDATVRYVQYIKESIKNTSLKSLKIVLDCANGAAYKVAPLVFSELGAKIILLNNSPDGNNINNDCGALHPKIVRDAVLKNNANLGITLDGDADRIIMVDETGKIIDGDYIIAIAAVDMLKKKTLKKNTVVVTHYTNLAFDKLIEKHGGKTVRCDNGDRYVIEAMEKGGYNLGGEFSGHIIFSDYNTTGDGIIAAIQILKIMKEKNKKLSELASILQKYPQVLMSVAVKEKKPFKEMKSVVGEIEKAKKMLGNEGRYLIRYSGTEMKARVMVEGQDEELITMLCRDIVSKIKKEVG
ncbi:MAG: phosphoglucosamine mutase [Nanoarchaeota archaeon]